ncbi:MAG: CHAT domain-containing protein [Cyanobacteria bacterium P01_F01_bin.150]
MAQKERYGKRAVLLCYSPVPMSYSLLSRLSLALTIALVSSGTSEIQSAIASPSTFRYHIAQSNAEDAETDPLLATCKANVQRPIAEVAGINYGEQQVKYEQEAISSCEAALAHYRAVGDRPREAETLSLLSVAFYRLLEEQPLEERERAVSLFEWLQSARTIYQELGDRPRETRTIYRLGLVYRVLRQADPGLDLLQQALAQYRQLGDIEWEVKTLQQLGRFYDVLDSPAESIAFFQQALERSQQDGNRDLEAQALYVFAHDYYLQNQQYTESIEIFERYLEIIRADYGPEAEADALQHLASVYDKSSRFNSDIIEFQASFDFAQRAQKIYQELDLREQQAFALSQMGHALARQSRDQEALELLMQAMDVAQTMGDRDRRTQLIWHIYKISQNIVRDKPESTISLQQHMLSIFQALGDPQHEAGVLEDIGNFYRKIGQTREALESQQRAYNIFVEINDVASQARLSRDLGTTYMMQGYSEFDPSTHGCVDERQYEQVISFYQRSIEHYQDAISQASNPTEKKGYQVDLAKLFLGMGDNASGRGCDVENAKGFYQQALNVYRQLQDWGSVVEMLRKLGNYDFYSQRYEEASALYGEALAIAQEHNPQQAIILLQTLSFQYLEIGDYEQALRFGEDQLTVTRTVYADIPFGQTNALEKLGQTYHGIALGRQWLAVTNRSRESSLGVSQTIARAVVSRRPLPDSLLATLAQAPLSDGAKEAHEQAIALYQQALTFYQEEGNVHSQMAMLTAIGRAYEAFQANELAASFFEQILALQTRPDDRAGEAQKLKIQAQRYLELDQYEEAIASYQQAYQIYEEIGWDLGLISLLERMGRAALELGQDQEALDYFYQAIAVAKDVSTISEYTPRFIGDEYLERGELSLTQEFYEIYIAQVQAKGDRIQLFNSMHDLAQNYYLREGYPTQALALFQRALALAYEIQEDPAFVSFPGVGMALESIGDVLATQNQADLAIVFYKSAVQEYQDIREGFEGTEFIDNADFETLFLVERQTVYRKLADMLLQRDRILEAQQVLDLLKVQELEDYLRDVRGVDETLTVLRPELEILAQYSELQAKAVEVGQELSQLRKRFAEGESLSAEEEAQFDQLLSLQEDLTNQFNSFVDRSDIQGWLAQLNPATVQKTVPLDALAAQQNTLADLNAVLLYPLILEDRLELILTLPNSETPPLRRTVSVSKAELNQAILDLRQALRNPTSDAITPAQQLYSYLIKPLEADLADVAALNGGAMPSIIYSPDSGLRYIPLAALHDGNQWLAERFRFNTITAESLAELQSAPVTNPSVVAGAFADPSISYTVSVGDRSQDFSGLPFAGEEVKNLAAALSNSTHFLDQDFSWTQLRRYMGTSNILHLATHAAFVPGNPEDSFILFGNGDRAVLECLDGASQAEGYSCINNWQLADVDLVVLSACETGLANPSILTDGEEVLGLGYQFQTRGAKAVMASLWKVSDGGTQALMDAFYGALQRSGVSKSEALRQAQIALITGDFSGLGLDERGAVAIRQRIQETVPQQVSQQLSHPYYWAPFIVIGNGL